jgi:hypothetical protein
MVEVEQQRGQEVADRLLSFGFELVERSSRPDRRRTTPEYGLFVRP